jgi:5-deoxy-D-glucuronate isomerase
MTNIFSLRASLLVATVLLLPVAQAAIITKVELNMAQTRISEALKAEAQACETLAAHAKNVCVEEVKGKEVVARAELQYEFSGRSGDQAKVLEAKAKSAYAVAKEKCDVQAGNAKEVCVQEAKAAEVKVLADAKLGQQIGEARKDGAQDILDADYTVASEKCNAQSGDAKARCIAATKSRFGKK